MKKQIKKWIYTSAAMGLAAGALLVNAGNVRAEGNETKAAVSKDGAAADKIYEIGSIGKVYISCAAMQLVDRGLVDLDEPVVTYIPDFKMADERYKDITVRMLMDHSSGLMGTTFGNAFLNDDNDDTAHEEFLKNLSTQRLKADPGEYSVYCNDGFDLLEILVERVTGMDATDYLTEYIAKPLSATQTGSVVNLFRNENLVKLYDANKQPSVVAYHIGVGAGGVLSTATEVCKFGSAFFEGNNTLLSEESKTLMATQATANKYEGRYGFGWDYVDLCEGTGVKVLYKGGSMRGQHAGLAVAPEEKISVSVLTTGTASSGLEEGLVARSLMNVVLKERGKDISPVEKSGAVLLDTVPAQYAEYEGLYTTGVVASCLMYKISFPDMKYLKMELMDSPAQSVTYYKYSEDGNFVRMVGEVPEGKGMEDPERYRIDFERRANGKAYITAEGTAEFQRLGAMDDAEYFAEQLEENVVSGEAQSAWQARSGRYYLTGVKYSNYAFEMGYEFIDVRLSETLPGYLYAMQVLQIKDEDHAAGFLNIPNQGSRDLVDITVEVIDGRECLYMEGPEFTYIHEKDIPAFTADVKELNFDKRENKWYAISRDDLGGELVGFDRTEETSIYIYDKTGNCVYNTYMGGFGDKIPLPTEGTIMFAGEPGAKISIVK